MKHYFILLWLLFSAGSALSGVEMVSLYFEEDNANPTGYTVDKMEDFRNSMEERHVQFIEINAFADAEGSAQMNKRIAADRLHYVFEYFGISDEGILVTNYGGRKIPLNFQPFNWSRVDIYYHADDDEYKPIVYPVNDVEINSVSTNIAVINESVVNEVPLPDEIPENTPIVLAIKFKDGSSKATQGEQPRLDQLYNTLVRYPDLTAHIRGHVCCSNKKLRSKQRAKYVYSYLRNKGIDKSRLSYKGYGNTEPIVFPERSNNDRGANRRVDVVFTKTNP